MIRDKCWIQCQCIGSEGLRILVTGATGFIGRKLVSALVASGHQITALVRETSNSSGLPTDVRFVTANLLDRRTLETAIGDNEAVIHLAAYFDFYPSDKDLLYKINIDGTVNLMNSCVGTSVKRFIYCSTAEVIGPVENPPGDEDSELRPAFDYSKSKLQAESRIREITQDTGLPHIILRPTGVMGDGDLYSGFELIEALNNGKVIAFPRDGSKHIMYTYIGDVVEAFKSAVTSDRALNETIIICPDEPMTFDDLLEFLINKLGVKGPRFRVPTILAKIGIGLLSPIKNRKKTTFLWHVATVQSLVEERWYSNSKAKELLNWRPELSIEEGLSRQIEWAYDNGHLERRY